MTDQEKTENEGKISEKEERLKKLQTLREKGIDPYPAGSGRTHEIESVLNQFTELEKSANPVTICGRLRSKRSHGNLTFCHLQDSSGQIQFALSKKEIGEEEYKDFTKLVDVGDFVQITGTAFVTHKGEQSLMSSDWKLLAKALRPLPDKWHGLKDEEEKLRKRYLDILLNPETREMIYKRAKFWQAMRQFMIDRGFLEVETPILEVTTGGADARPFSTHHNALDMDVFLRISMGELWQKRLMVAGLEKTFEIGRLFRNEGMSSEHLQDYSQIEFYWAYADFEDGIKIIEELYKYVAQETFGTHKFKIRGFDVDLGKKWERYDYRETVKQFTGIDILKTNEAEIKAKLDELGVDYEQTGFNITRAIDNLWKYCRKQIAGPGFLVGVPLAVSPLAKKDEKHPELTQRFQPIIAGSEMGNGYSELNDPIDQAERFADQQKLRDAGDEEAQMYDHEFVEALEYGMPPTFGFGTSERLFSFFMDKPVRECQIFPLLKPKASGEESAGAAPANNQAEDQDLGISYEQAKELTDAYITDEKTKLHLRETEVIMRALADYFGEDEEKWGIIGLLHDIDWDKTKEDTKNHTIKAKDILSEAGASQFLIDAVVSHTYGNKECGEHPDLQRSTRLEHCLAAAETVTGLIVAAALMQPDKKINSVKLSSLKKKFKDKRFAANCDREIIREIEQTGIGLEEFFDLSLKALSGISDELDL